MPQLLLLSLSMLLWIRPEIHEITPPCGGWVVDHARDWTWAAGYSPAGPWLYDGNRTWTLARMMSLPPYLTLLMCQRHDDGWLLVVTWYDEVGAPHTGILRLPLDIRSLFSPADFDFDGDVDQTDFGYLQRTLGTPEQPMSVAEFEWYATGARR